MSLDVHTIKALKDAGLTAEQITQVLAGSASKPVNTTDSIKAKAFELPESSKGQLMKAARKFAREPKVGVTIPVPYGTYTGGFVKVGLNGVTVELPANGKEYKVPKSLAIAFKERLHNLDTMYSKAGPSLGTADTSAYMSTAGLVSGKVGSNDGFVKVDTSDYSG